MDFEKKKIEIHDVISKQDESKVLDNVKKFQAISKSLREDLATLTALKKKGQADEHTKELIAKTFSTIIQLRMNHRDLYTVCYDFR
jgi:hypothetical protein